MADFNYVVQNFTLSTGTGTQDITVSGLTTQPSAVMFIVSGATANDTAAASQRLCIGYTDGTRDRSHSISSYEGGSASDGGVMWRKDACISFCTEFGGTGEDNSFSFNSWITTGDYGVRLDIDNQSDDAFLGIAIFFYGSDITNVRVDGMENLGTGTTPVAITSPSFQPNLLIISGMNKGSNVDGGADDQAFLSLGFGVDSDGAGTVEQGCSAFYTVHSNDPQINTSIIRNNAIVAGLSDGAEDWYGGLDSFDASGFSIDPSASSGTSYFSYLAFNISNSPDLAVFDFDWPTSGSINEETPGFNPEGVLMITDGQVGTINTVDSTDIGGINIVASDGTNTYTTAATAQDQDFTPTCKSWQINKVKIIGDDNSVQVDSSAFAFDSLGYNITLTTNPSTAFKGVSLVIGQGGVTNTDIEIPVGPVW